MTTGDDVQRCFDRLNLAVAAIERGDAALSMDYELEVLSRQADPQADALMIQFFEKAALSGAWMQAWAVGEAWRVGKAKHLLPVAARLAKDQRYGRARESMVLLLGELQTHSYVTDLVDLLRDPVVCGHAIHALGRLRNLAPSQTVLDLLRDLLKEDRAFVRVEAATLLVKLGDVSARQILEDEARSKDENARSLARKKLKSLAGKKTGPN